MMDLTTLEGQDTPGKVAYPANKWRSDPDPFHHDRALRSQLSVSTRISSQGAKERLAGSGVKVASVATAFPSGQAADELKVAETRAVIELGADEVDMVIDRGVHAGRYSQVYYEKSRR